MVRGFIGLYAINRGEMCEKVSPALRWLSWWRRLDSNLLHYNELQHTEPIHNHDRTATNPCVFKQLDETEIQAETGTCTLSEQNHDSSLRSKCALCVHQISTPDDLKSVIDAWLELPEVIRKAIMALIQAAKE